MKKLILDKSKWVCGMPPANTNINNYLGEGDAKLLNDYGYMCCLGQFCQQLNTKITNDQLLNMGYPSNLNSYCHDNLYAFINGTISSQLTKDAVTINDRTSTTIDEKIEQLKELFAKYDFEIEVIN